MFCYKCSAEIPDESVHLAEGQDKVPHELTKREAQALLEYKEEVKRYSWASKPQIRKYDKVYNGKLRIVFGNGKYLKDSESTKLEDRLGEILVCLTAVLPKSRFLWQCCRCL